MRNDDGNRGLSPNISKGKLVVRVSFAFQYFCLLCVLVAYLLAISAPSFLQSIYEFLTTALQINQDLLSPLQIKSATFPQAGVHSLITSIGLGLAYVAGLWKAISHLQDKIMWDSRDVSALREKLRSGFFSKALVPLLSSYVSAPGANLDTTSILKPSEQLTTSASKAWLAYFFSKTALSLAVVELLLPLFMLFFASPSRGSDVGIIRFFTTNTIMIFFACGLGFKLILTTMAFMYPYLKGEA